MSSGSGPAAPAGGDNATAAAPAAAAFGGSKRPVSPSIPAGGAGDEADAGGKRQRVASSEGAGPSSSSGGSCPLDRVPDTPMHLLRVRGIPSWANEGFLGLTLGDLVRGDMRWCLISNYLVDVAWLLSACPDLKRAGRILLVHGEQRGSSRATNLVQDLVESGLRERCSLHAPPLPIQFGTHHSKAFLIEYERGLRVIILTANAIYADCNNKSQGLFWQDFPHKDNLSPQTSAFQQELASYLRELQLPAPAARKALQLVEGHDFSAARAHIIASVPGYHTGAAVHKWGHLRLRAVLNRAAPFDPEFAGAPVACQYSSLGSLDEPWMSSEFMASLAAGRCGNGSRLLGQPAAGAAGLQLVWPTVGEVKNSLEGWFAGNSIPGPAKNVGKPFLQRYYCRWGGEVCGRQRAAPHIKTYVRYRGQDVAWMYVGSHNLSKAAWGTLQKKGTQLMCRSYELGVLLTPALEAAYRVSRWRGFSCTSSVPPPAMTQQLPSTAAASDAGADSMAAAPAVRFVAWQRGASQEAQPAEDGTLRVPLPVPYSLPPQRYQAGDQAWAWDTAWPGLDMRGCTQDGQRGQLYGLTEQMNWDDLF